MGLAPRARVDPRTTHCPHREKLAVLDRAAVTKTREIARTEVNMNLTNPRLRYPRDIQTGFTLTP